MKKTLRWSILLSLVLICLMIPVMAQRAEAINYHVYVGETLVTDENCTDVLGDETVKYEPKTSTDPWSEGTLILNNPSIASNNQIGLIQSDAHSMTVEGKADFTASNTYGIYLKSDENYLNLTLSNTELKVSAVYAIGSDGNIIVTGEETNIVSEGTRYGIYARKGITISGGTVTAIGGTAAFNVEPDLSGYKGEYIVMVSDSTTGDNATKWDETTSLTSYKYVKIGPVPTFTVTWKNDDGSVIDTTTVEYGVVPIHDDVTKAADAQYTYTFAGWTPDLVAVTGDAEYTATYTETVIEYTVTWKNDDGSVIDTTTVEYGVVPTHADVTKAADAQYTYTFAGWDPAITAVTGDATYTATYDKTVNEYTITWKNGDVVLKTDTVKYGDTPSYTGAEPTKAPSAEYTYTFAGWTPKITAVTGDQTYTADFDIARRTYTITWKNDDGSVIGTTEVEYGKTPMYPDQKKEADDQYTYTFAGWDPIPAAVAADATYTATYNATPINTYPVWVGGVQVTEKNLDDILGDNTGSAMYDPDSYTLTLNNPEITDTYKDGLIHSENIDLTIAGVAGLKKITDADGISVFGGDLTLFGAKLTIESEYIGIYAEGNIDVTDYSSVKVFSEKARGIYTTGGGVWISDSMVTAVAKSENGYGISALANITVSGEKTIVTADGGQFGICSDAANITISGGKVTATQTIKADSDNAYAGIRTNKGDITISGKSTVVTVDAACDGICARGDLCITDAKVTSKGSLEDGYFDGLSGFLAVTIENADVEATGRTAIYAGWYPLTIRNSTVKAVFSMDALYNGDSDIIIEGSEVTIENDPEGTFPNSEGINASAVSVSDSKVTVTGNMWRAMGGGTLSIDGSKVDITTNSPLSASYAAGLWSYSGDLTVSDSVITVKTTAETVPTYALYSNQGEIKISGENTVVTATATGEKGKAIYAEKGDITISGGEVTATATGDFDRAICAEEGDITISGGTVAAEGDYYGIIARKNITISGDKTVVTVAMTGEDGFAALCAYTGDITISGSEVNATAKGEVGIYADKSITISGGNVTAEGKEYGIYSYADNITISGGTVTAEGKERGICASKQLTISGGTVNATATGNEGYAIRAWGGDIIISGGEMNATATGKNGNAICAEEGNITISGDATVNATATGEKGKAIYAEKGDITISGGEVNATAEGELAEAIHAKEGTIKITSATVNATSEDDCAIYAGDITIDGATVTVGNFYGIIAESLDSNKGNLWISDSTIKANTKGYCIYSGGGELIISDSNVEAMATYGPGISGNSLITISGSTITAAGDTHGIEGECSKITISNSTVDLKGDRYGIYAPKAEITIEGKDTEVKAEGGKLAAILASADTIIVNEPLAILDPQGGVIGETTDDGKQYQTIFASDGETVAKKVYIAEGGTSGGILVVDPETGEPVIGGTVSLIDPATGEVLDSWTPDGKPQPLPGSLPPGEYTIVVELPDGTVIETTIIVGEDGTVSIVGPDGELIPVAPDEVITVGGSGKKYTITWIIDGKEETEKYAAGEMPSHKTPKKASDVLCDYEFIDWTPEIVKVTADATYTAEFEAVLSQFSPFNPFSPFSPFNPNNPYGPNAVKPGTSGSTDGSGSSDSSGSTGGVNLPFTDVDPLSPMAEIIEYVYENGIMEGVSETEFDPYGVLNRGMIVTILWRIEGKPAVTYSGAFTDVPDGMWYTDGVEWAASHGIVLGYGDGRYGPTDPVTREQLAAIFFRYSNFKGYTIRTADFTADDAGSVSPWAVEYVKWAVANDVLWVSDGTVRPTVPALRWEVAVAIRSEREIVAK